jgi:hypothetical protein
LEIGTIDKSVGGALVDAMATIRGLLADGVQRHAIGFPVENTAGRPPSRSRNGSSTFRSAGKAYRAMLAFRVLLFEN